MFSNKIFKLLLECLHYWTVIGQSSFGIYINNTCYFENMSQGKCNRCPLGKVLRCTLDKLASCAFLFLAGALKLLVSLSFFRGYSFSIYKDLSIFGTPEPVIFFSPKLQPLTGCFPMAKSNIFS